MDIEILLKKISQKTKDSRQYTILVNRINKAFRKALKYREIRYREESIEQSKEISKNSIEKVIENLKKISLKNVIKK